MSQQGIKACAAIFSQMQELRIKLLRCDPHDQQDILLGQMLDAGKDAMKADFVRATSDPRISPETKANKERRERNYGSAKEVRT